MARSLNKAIIIGNLGSDPEIRTTGSGTRVANFSVATSRSWKNQAGEQQEKTEWHRIVCWDKLAEIVERYLKKGNQVYIEGEIEYRSYEDKDGVTKYSTEIRAREMMMLGGRDGDGSGGGGAESGASRGGSTPARSGGKSGSDYDDFQSPPLGGDDDLPF